VRASRAQVIQSLTADGRDRSLDYKISGFHVPPGSFDARVRACARTPRPVLPSVAGTTGPARPPARARLVANRTMKSVFCWRASGWEAVWQSSLLQTRACMRLRVCQVSGREWGYCAGCQRSRACAQACENAACACRMGGHPTCPDCLQARRAEREHWELCKGLRRLGASGWPWQAVADPCASGGQVLDCIAPGPDDIVLPKTSASVFISTSLDYILRSLGKRQARASGRACCGCAAGAAVLMLRLKCRPGLPPASHSFDGAAQVVLAGALTDQCVEGAVRDACDLQYLVTLVSGARASCVPTRTWGCAQLLGDVPVTSKRRTRCGPCLHGGGLQAGGDRGPGPVLVRGASFARHRCTAPVLQVLRRQWRLCSRVLLAGWSALGALLLALFCPTMAAARMQQGS